MPGLTLNTFLDFINSEFKRLKIEDFEAIEAIRTRYRPDDYEAGACKLIIRIKDKRFKNNELLRNSFFCYYSINEYRSYLKNGYEMYLKFNDNYFIIRNATIEVRKPVNKIEI